MRMIGSTRKSSARALPVGSAAAGALRQPGKDSRGLRGSPPKRGQPPPGRLAAPLFCPTAWRCGAAELNFDAPNATIALRTMGGGRTWKTMEGPDFFIFLQDSA